MGEWISTKKELPKEIGAYLCYDNYEKCQVIYEFNPKKGQFIDYDDRGYPYTHSHVSHWMKLPDDPPKTKR